MRQKMPQIQMMLMLTSLCFALAACAGGGSEAPAPADVCTTKCPEEQRIQRKSLRDVVAESLSRLEEQLVEIENRLIQVTQEQKPMEELKALREGFQNASRESEEELKSTKMLSAETYKKDRDFYRTLVAKRFGLSWVGSENRRNIDHFSTTVESLQKTIQDLCGAFDISKATESDCKKRSKALTETLNRFQSEDLTIDPAQKGEAEEYFVGLFEDDGSSNLELSQSQRLKFVLWHGLASMARTNQFNEEFTARFNNAKLNQVIEQAELRNGLLLFYRYVSQRKAKVIDLNVTNPAVAEGFSEIKGQIVSAMDLALGHPWDVEALRSAIDQLELDENWKNWTYDNSYKEPAIKSLMRHRSRAQDNLEYIARQLERERR